MFGNLDYSQYPARTKSPQDVSVIFRTRAAATQTGTIVCDPMTEFPIPRADPDLIEERVKDIAHDVFGGSQEAARVNSPLRIDVDVIPRDHAG